MAQTHILLILLLPLLLLQTLSSALITPSLPIPYLHPLKQQQQRSLHRPTTTTTPTTTALHATPSSKVKFYVTNQSLHHLQSITNNFGTYKPPPWTAEKSIAVAGVALGAILAGTIGHYLGENLNWLDAKAVTILLAFVGGGIGWATFGGEKISRIDMAEDGGTQVKFIVDRPERLQHIVDVVEGAATDNDSIDVEVVTSSSNTNNEEEDHYKDIAERYIQSTHTPEYLTELIDATNDSASMAKPRRLYPRYARTMIDGQSYDAALHCVMDWIHAVDTVTLSGKKEQVVPFVLTRPPSHHATQRQGMGGCLLNSIGIAAKYALDTYKPNVINTVAILDIDAHHGNGIADVVSDESNIRYCSLHEYDGSGGIGDVTHGNVVNPRSPSKDDVGPIGNLKNVILEPGTDWTKYEMALRNEAIPFLLEVKPDLILVAAGFDALEQDFTSSLRLQIEDYEKIGIILKETFGDKGLVFGLEGGYTWKSGELGDALISLVRPWCV